MQQPIRPGTLLQNRYRLTKTLGQGGFGRTYLAEDQARFNELCAIKEYVIPNQGGSYVLEKSKELFQREGAVLYQIQHRQIPQFRAAFEQGKRLFLVQDYAEGKTYRALLDDRLEQGQTFSEGEMVQFLLQMLPVLEHIHAKGIVHRDISPENIILRESDRLPVLIDFGAVKQGVAQLQSSGEVPQGTTMGKIGYSPDEQLRTGEVFPNSDLYALAVTVVVLMTGRKPQDLLDKSTMTWRWHQWVPTLSPWFAKVLNRMLNPRPHNRYQSATEVAQTLRSLSDLLPPPIPPVADPTKIQIDASPHRQSNLTNPVPSSFQQSRTSVSRLTNNPIWNSPWLLLVVGGGAVLLLTVVPVILLGSMFSNKREQTSQKLNVTPVPTFPSSSSDPTSTPSASPTPSQSVQPVPQGDRLNLKPGQTISKEGNLKGGQTITYIIPGQPGQQLSATLSRGFCAMNVSAPGNSLLAQQVQQWEGVLQNGDYYIQVSPQPGITQSDFKLDLSLANSTLPVPSASIPIPLNTPTSSPSPSASPSKLSRF